MCWCRRDRKGGESSGATVKSKQSSTPTHQSVRRRHATRSSRTVLHAGWAMAGAGAWG